MIYRLNYCIRQKRPPRAQPGRGLKNWAEQELKRGKKGILDTAVPEFEKIMIEMALKHTGGRRRDASILLGWGRNTLTRKINELGLDHPESDED